MAIFLYSQTGKDNKYNNKNIRLEKSEPRIEAGHYLYKLRNKHTLKLEIWVY